MVLKLWVVAAGLVGLSATAAAAQWMASPPEENAFEKTRSQWVFTVKDGLVFGFGCNGSDADEARLVFVTTERFEAETARGINATSPKLAFIIDNGERVDLDAQIDAVPLMGFERLRVTAKGAAAIDVADRIAGARKKVAVAVGALGQTYHATTFSVSGSRRVVAEAMTTCGLQPGRAS